MISAFINIKDGVKGKYPFVESILSALPLCDQFIVSDGYSTDGTWEVLKKLADSHPKIELVKVEWKSRTNKNGEILAKTANETREYCKGDYLYYIQANEVLHEDSIDAIRSLPRRHPKLKLFHIPYNIVFGTNIIGFQEYRLRFVKNIERIKVSGDAMHMCYQRSDILKGVMSALKNPRTFETSLKTVMTPYGFDNEPFAHVMLPKPAFRYGSMFRKSLLEKMKVRRALNAYSDSTKSINKLTDYVIRETNSRNFGQKLYELTKKEPPPYSSAFLYEPIRMEIGDHPRIMQGLLKQNPDSYYIRKELLK